MKFRVAIAKQRLLLAVLSAGFSIGAASTLVGAQPMMDHQGHEKGTDAAPVVNRRTLPPVPENLPRWMSSTRRNHIYRKRGPYNDDIRNIPALERDLNAVAVGHAMAYEDLVTGKADGLETDTFKRINWVLKNPPRFMPDEANISPTFGRKYGVLEQVFDWTHILHAQTVDVLASTDLSEAEKEAEIERLYQFYATKAPYVITSLPMNMGYLDSQPYSKSFRQQYPKVNGLFWGYHWLQGVMYDTLYGKSLAEQRDTYATLGKRYHEVELYRTDRPFMPMFAEVSPKFAQKFPHISNTFDNLHMLHDMVNDILASDWMSEEQQEEQIKRAIWMVSADAHKGMKPGDFDANNSLHDHRFMAGMPGMGMMPNMEGMDHSQMQHGDPSSAGQEPERMNPMPTHQPQEDNHEQHAPAQNQQSLPNRSRAINPGPETSFKTSPQLCATDWTSPGASNSRTGCGPQ